MSRVLHILKEYLLLIFSSLCRMNILNCLCLAMYHSTGTNLGTKKELEKGFSERVVLFQNISWF